MEKLNYINCFYLDKEKDIVVNLYQTNEDEITYVLKTPNHSTGNLITNLAKVCNMKTVKDKDDMKIITGKIFASINSNNEEVYIFRMGGYKIANIFKDGRIEIKAKIPAISKTLMSQTKTYRLPIEKTIVKSYIIKRLKFRTDLHTHMNANLSPDCLIALGIKHQIKYPLYYIKKLNLKMTQEQEEKILNQRKIVEKEFKNSDLTGKYLIRRIDDNTFINFADFILNNLDNARENIEKIRNSLAILKDGQAVFTNLEKLYLYRYVFAKGTESDEKIKLDKRKIEKIFQKDIKDIVLKMIDDSKNSFYKNNTLRQDKLLWIAREYQKQGVYYIEIADTTLTKLGSVATDLLEEIHDVMPKIEKETGVAIRFLVAIRRVPLTIIKDAKTSKNYLRENIDVLKAVSKSPYVVGCDIIGEEINDISELKPAIEEVVQYVVNEDEGFTIRIHAGENDSLKNNVLKSIECVKLSLKQGQKMPRLRIGHGLYVPDLSTKEGKELIKLIKECDVVIEFQITSNVRLNNLTKVSKHPLKKYLDNDVKCVQGTDGCGFYGTDVIDEQLALQNLLGLTDSDFEKMKIVGDEIINHRKEYFINKSKKFEEFLNGRSITEAVLDLENKNIHDSKNSKIKLRLINGFESEIKLKHKIKDLPDNKIPIIIAGGSFNAKGITTVVDKDGENIIKKLIKKVNPEKVFFVIGHKLQGYEKLIIDYSKKFNKEFEIYAIIPKLISKEENDNLLNKFITGVRISTESEELGIYKSFNYEIFERRNSIVIAFDGNSPVSNLVQEAKNGKGKAKIYVNKGNSNLREKGKNLGGYVNSFELKDDVVSQILEDSVDTI